MGIRGMVRRRLRGQVPVQLLGKHTETFVLQPPESHISQGKQGMESRMVTRCSIPSAGHFGRASQGHGSERLQAD